LNGGRALWRADQARLGPAEPASGILPTLRRLAGRLGIGSALADSASMRALAALDDDEVVYLSEMGRRLRREARQSGLH